MELPRGARRCEKTDSIGGEWGFLRRSFVREWERFAKKVGEGCETRIPLSPYRHFEQSEKSSLHSGKRESVR